MELIKILNRCHHFRGFVYQHARFSPDRKSIECRSAATQGLRGNLFALSSDGAGVRSTRRTRFEFIPKAVDEVRAAEARRTRREGRAPVLKKSRWPLLGRRENLDEQPLFRLPDLLRYNLKTVPYLLKEAFQQLWEYNSPAWAGKLLEEWRPKPCVLASSP